MTIDLRKFCSPDDPRRFLNAPAAHNGLMVASDGYILLCVPADVEGTIAHDSFVAAVAEAQVHAACATHRVPVASALRADHQPCADCNGSGFVTEVDCEHCHNGTFSHGDSDYECKDCDGKGAVSMVIDGEPTRCAECSGSGLQFSIGRYVPTTIGSGNSTVDAKFIALIHQSLPDAEITQLRSADGRYYFRSPCGAFGAVMELKKPSEAAFRGVLL